MKKTLLASASICVIVLVAPSAMAASDGVKLELSGYYKAYAGYADQQEIEGGASVNNVGYLQSSEIHFNGETRLDNGLLVGVHFELKSDTTDGDFEESYAYFEGDWGHINAGAKDGAAYLLQVAAPSADSNYDGIKQTVSPFNYNSGVVPSSIVGLDPLQYKQNPTGYSEKITYLSPVFSGFQAGITYAPDVDPSNTDTAFGFPQKDDDTQGAGYEGALRYEGEISEFNFSLGGGYSLVEIEDNASTIAGADDQNVWNVGLDIDWHEFGLGTIYTSNDQGNLGNDREVDTFVIGADYTYDQLKFGASWLNQQEDITSNKDVETDRFTGGVIYTYGSGLTFRGSVSYIYHDVPQGQENIDGFSVLLGTQIIF